MCLASEAGKMDTIQFHPEDSSSKASLQQTAVKPEIKEEKFEPEACPPSSHTSTVLPLLSSVTPTSDAIPPQLGSQNARVKNKSKKKEVTRSNDKDELPCSAKKIIKKCNHTESNIDSVFSTIEAVAKGAWKDTDEKPKKKLQSSPCGGHSAVPKKKSKPKLKNSVKEKEEVEDSGQCGQCSSSEVEMKEEMSVFSMKTEAEEPSVASTDLQGYIPESHHSPCSSSPPKFKEEDKGREGSNDGTCESNTESRGSRKSERRCKGALYKTLVSEGMLTSLRANIDRGIQGQTD